LGWLRGLQLPAQLKIATQVQLNTQIILDALRNHQPVDPDVMNRLFEQMASNVYAFNLAMNYAYSHTNLDRGIFNQAITMFFDAVTDQPAEFQRTFISAMRDNLVQRVGALAKSVNTAVPVLHPPLAKIVAEYLENLPVEQANNALRRIAEDDEPDAKGSKSKKPRKS